MIIAERPRLRPGTELIGEFQGSALTQTYYLARRGDGNVVRMSELPYLVAFYIDGARDCEEIARLVSEQSGRQISPMQVSYLVRTKLQHSGLTEGEGSVAKAPRPMLTLRPRGVLIPRRAVLWLAHIMRPLFLPPVVIAMLLGALAVDAWLLAHTNLIAAIDDLLRQELHLPLVIGLVLLSGLFHECGHATALRYGGATPGAIGGGIYIIWPVFYSDVTDAYRLDRRGRLRVDLGGVYFQCIFALATAIGYLATGFEPLLLVTFFQYVSIAQQFIPFLRLDGYYVISDLIGVPELFSHVRPTLSSLFRRSAQGQPANELRSRWASLAVTAWVALTVPALALFFAYIVAYTPWIFTTSFDLLHERLSEMMAANGSPISASAAALRVALGLVPVIGLSVLYLRIAVVSVRFLSRIRLRPRSRRAIARLYLRIAVASSRLLSRIRLSPRVRTSLNPGDLGGAERRISEATVLTIVLAVLVLAAVIVIGRGSQQAEGPVQEPAAEQKEQPAEEPAAGSETNSVDERTNEQPADSSATSETVQVTVRVLGDPAGLTILTDGMVAADPLAQPGYSQSASKHKE